MVRAHDRRTQLRVDQPSTSCSPTGKDRDGIWVVNRWEPDGAVHTDRPGAAEAQGIERLEKFLAARVAGEGGEEH